MSIFSRSATDVAWSNVGVAYRALIYAIRRKPQPNTVKLWQEFALACQILANTMWTEERTLSPTPAPPPPQPTPTQPAPFDPRITKWVDSSGNENFDFPSCPFKVGNP